MAAGLAALAATVDILLAGIAGDAALRFDPADSRALVAALNRIACEAGLRARLAVAGPLRAAHFSWRNTAQSTLAALQASYTS